MEQLIFFGLGMACGAVVIIIWAVLSLDGVEDEKTN